jgi:hypothetical protein
MNNYNWDRNDPVSMAKFIMNSGMPLDINETNLLRKVMNDFHYVIGAKFSAYDLFELNLLCYQVLGFRRK